MNPTKKHQKQRKILSETFSKTSNTNDDKQQQKINEPEEEIRRLKATQNITADTTNIDQTKINTPLQNLKTRNTASATNKGQQENIDLLKVISVVEKTMKDLSNYREQLKIQLDFNLSQQRINF